MGFDNEAHAGNKMVHAMRVASAVPGNSLPEQVDRALNGNYGTEALRDVKDALDALDAGLGRAFWRLCGSHLDNTNEKAEFVRLVRERTAVPA